jgi:hypothetical protein
MLAATASTIAVPMSPIHILSCRTSPTAGNRTGISVIPTAGR